MARATGKDTAVGGVGEVLPSARRFRVFEGNGRKDSSGEMHVDTDVHVTDLRCLLLVNCCKKLNTKLTATTVPKAL